VLEFPECWDSIILIVESAGVNEEITLLNNNACKDMADEDYPLKPEGWTFISDFIELNRNERVPEGYYLADETICDDITLSKLQELDSPLAIYGGTVNFEDKCDIDAKPWSPYDAITGEGLELSILVAKAVEEVLASDSFGFKPAFYTWTGNWTIIAVDEEVPEGWWVADMDFIRTYQA
jgi:hypothetical protein